MNNNHMLREVFDGFGGGLSLSSPHGKISHSIDNFRVLEDGSIQKREGAKLIAKLPDTVRGICSYVDADTEILLAAAGNSLYRISPSDGQVIGNACFSTNEGKVGFFTYRGRLYIMEGTDFWRYEGGCAVSRAYGYTPLYGVNWKTYHLNSTPVNQDINYLCPRIRIHYLIEDPTTYAYVGLSICSVDWVTVDDHPLDKKLFHVSKDRNWVLFDEEITGNNMEVCVTLDKEYYQNTDFLSSRSAAIYENFDRSRVFLYGGNDSLQLFISCLPTLEEAEKDSLTFSDSCGLYFPKGKSLRFGNGQTVTAVQQLYDRMMVFFPSSLWISEPMDEAEDKELLLFAPLCEHMGCPSPHAFFMMGTDSPIAVAHGGIYRWHIDSEFIKKCSAKPIAAAIHPLLDKSFFRHAEVCYHRCRSELWFRDKSKQDGRIFIHHLDKGIWYSYSGLSIDGLFEFGGGIGYIKDGHVYLFDENLAVDVKEDGEYPITGVLESGHLDFGELHADKHLTDILLRADIGNGELSVSVSDGHPLCEASLGANPTHAPDIYEIRTPTGRFRSANLRLTASGNTRQRIYRAELFAQKGKS